MARVLLVNGNNGVGAVVEVGEVNVVNGVGDNDGVAG